MRSQFLFLALVAVLAIPLASRSETPPNIVFFFADDQTTSTIGCYGNDVVQTPTLDSLAERGVRFENMFVSHSICWVSRKTILTGLYGRSLGLPDVPDTARPEAVEELHSDILRDAGYRTGYFGKWHAKMPKGYQPADHFDEFEAIGRNPFYKKMPDGSLRHETELIVDRGIEFVKNQPEGKPFALNLWFNACHAEDGDRRPGIGHFAWPRTADDLYNDTEIDPPRLNDPAIFDALPDFLQTSITRERFFWRWNTPDKYQTNIRGYYRMVSGIDNEIARFLDALEEAGLADNTIVVYSADNGFHMGNRGLAGKWSHYEESIRVPLIIYDPRLPESKRGQVTDALALNVDLPATFLDWAGVPVPERYEGASLKPVIESGTPDDWRTETFHEHYAVRNRIPAFEGVRTAKYKYVRYFDNDYEFLHDLEADPDELVNLVKDPEHAETLEELRTLTAARVEAVGGPLAPMGQKLSVSTPPHPVASAAVTVKPGPDGWVNIQPGKGLRGWVGDPELWSVKDGILTGVTDGSLKMNRFITWKGSTIRNFELLVDVKVSPGGNSGIQYRGKMAPEHGLDVVTGYQCDVVANNPRYNGMLYEERGRRILSHTGEKVVIDETGQPWVVGTLPSQEVPAGEWHEFRVLVEGNHHRHWVGGHPTADLVDLDESGRSLDGVLGVQVHVGPAMTIQYRNFRIRHLPDDLPLKTRDEVEIPDDAYGVRPQGRLPKDWKPPIYEEQ